MVVLISAPQGANGNARDEQASTPVYVATLLGHAATLEVLLSRGASPDVSDAEGVSPLHLAVLSGQSNLVVVLQSSIADAHSLCTENRSVLRALLAHQSRLTVVDNRHRLTPLHLAMAVAPDAQVVDFVTSVLSPQTDGCVPNRATIS